MSDDNCLTPAELADLESIECTGSDEASVEVPYHPELDWSGVPASSVAEVRKAAGRIRARHGRIIESILETGVELLRIKDLLGHGKFGPWLLAEFGWTARTAENYMSVAREFAGKPEFARLMPQKLLYDLAAKSVPAALRQEIISEAEAGKTLEEADIKLRIAQAKEAARAKTGKTATVTSEGSDASSSQEVDTTSSMSSVGPDAVMSIATDTGEISAEATTPVEEEPLCGETTTAADREQEEREQAARLVRRLQEKLGDKFEGFRKLLRRLSTPVFLDALEAAAPLGKVGHHRPSSAP